MANMQLVLAAHFNQVLVSIHAKWEEFKMNLGWGKKTFFLQIQN